ncbi:MAG: hypothetical protein NT069_31725, partial [Planctomycetota bacterium]|nr:hypothetical protein [Planctomycetota bacterium]
MDKLKQVLKYQFWILLGLAVIFPLVGWFLASSGLAKGYEEREKKLNARFTELKASPADANGDWESNLKKLNDVQQLELAKAWVSLWEPQQELKVWPEKLSTTDPENFTSADKGYYRKNYLALREAVFKQIQPVVEDEEDGKRKGRVAISLDTFPISEALGGPRVDNPTSQEIEDAHEDLWLCSALIQVVNILNRDSSSQLDAIIPEISVFELRGGAKGGASAPKKAAPATGGTQGMLGMSPEAMMNMAKDQQKALGIGKMGPNGGGNALSGGGEGTTVGVIPTVAFNPNDEFGDQGENPKQRYIDNKDEWKTRGFYLEMKINQSRVPELLVELSNCAWPIRITRVHIADVREEELIAADGGAMP